MSHFVMLGKLTQQGLTGIMDVEKRYEAFKKLVESKGGKIVAEYVTLGPYDYVIFLELPNSKAAMKVSVATSMMGNVSFETLRAFPIKQFIRIVEKA